MDFRFRGAKSSVSKKPFEIDILYLVHPHCIVWGGRLRKRFCNMFSESSTGSWAELQLPYCPSKQGELPENLLLNLPVSLIGQKSCLLFFEASGFAAFELGLRSVYAL